MKANKYSAACATCSVEVPANGGTITREGRRWIVRHTACADAGAPAVLHATTSSGHTSSVNARGMCEDAPCCGCCSGDMNVY